MGKIPWRRDRLPTPVFMRFPGGSDGKGSACNVGYPGSDPWFGKIPWSRAWQLPPIFLPGEFHGQRSLQATVLGVAKSQTRLSTHTHTHTHTHELCGGMGAGVGEFGTSQTKN